MGTTVTLDPQRREMIELPYHCTRRSTDIIAAQGGKNCVYKWPFTGSWTLQPINMTPAFYETANWEALKFRLSDCTYQPGFWTETPDNTRQGVGPCDFFLNGIVSSDNAPGNLTNGGLVLSNATDTFATPLLPNFTLTDNIGVNAIQSLAQQPANMGYCLRFHADGRGTQFRSNILKFFFADFSLALNLDGIAVLYQTIDFATYGVVHAFNWANPATTIGRAHDIYIFPHARNVLEFLCGQSYASGENAVIGSAYRIPGEILYDANGVAQVTKANNWSLNISREFRPFVQVSRLGFVNGTNPGSIVYDGPIDVGCPVSMGMLVQPDFDVNGGSASWGIIDGNTIPVGQPFQNGSRVFQFYFSMQGKGDVPGPGLASTITPELYGYSVVKPPRFQWVGGDGPTVTQRHFEMDFGDSPESERLAIVLNNERGQVDAYAERPDIPILLQKDGLTLFEGTAHTVQSGEAPAYHARALTLDAHGMVDQLLRCQWPPLPPNFAKDPYDASGRPWYWTDAVRHSFQAAGFAPDDVIIEEESAYSFRLWADGNTGGTRGTINSADKGDGHAEGATQSGQRWMPNPCSFIHEFLDYLIRQVMGWNYVWDRSDHRWHVYRRPRANEPFVPKVAFYKDGASWTASGGLQGNPPSYKHTEFRKETKRPECTTLFTCAQMAGWQFLTKAQLKQAILNAQSSPNPEDPIIDGVARLCWVTYDNPNGYASLSHPNPDKTSPDYLSRMRVRTIPLWEVSTKDSFEWIGRRVYEDKCLGYVYGSFIADWGDANTYNLRKWDPVLVDDVWYRIDHIEPESKNDRLIRARYRVSKWRADAPPPR